MQRMLFVVLILVSTNSLQAQDFLPEYARGTPMDAYLPPPPLLIQGKPPAASDVDALEGVVDQYYEAWWAEDAEGLIATFWPDAHWTNAFGLVIRGHDEMRDFFPEMFKHFDATETERSQTIHVRFVGDDVAIMQRYTQSGGGVANRDGEGLRQVQVTNVLQKRNGEWKSLHSMIMDVRL